MNVHERQDLKKVLIAYTCYPHYRSAIVDSLSNSNNYQYIFSGSETPQDSSIKLMQFEAGIPRYEVGLKFIGPFIYQPGLLKIIWNNNFDAVIFLGNPYIVSYWICTIFLRMKGIPVLFWTHGWINSKEAYLKKKFRNIFYKLSNGLLLYGERAKRIGMKYGFNRDELFVIYNCLDFEKMKNIYTDLDQYPTEELKKKHNVPTGHNVIICSARLTDVCRFDLLITAASILMTRGRKVFVILIGDGPVRNDLENQAEKLSVPLKVTGSCYDEIKISEYYKLSDLAVSPGKVGLSAMHSLTYRTPMITHDDFDKQMPEYEAIVPGVTGDFFKEGDAKDLAFIIDKWFGIIQSDQKIGQQCIDRINDYFSPSVQVREIENALERYTL